VTQHTVMLAWERSALTAVRQR